MIKSLNYQQLPSTVGLVTRILSPRLSVKRGQFLSAPSWQVKGFSFNKDQLNEYNRFCKFDSPSLPLTYLFVASQHAQLSYLSQKGMAVKLLGLVHVSIEFYQQQVISLEQQFELRVHLGEQSWTDKGLQFDLEVEFYSSDELKVGFVSRYLYLQPVSDSKKRSERSSRGNVDGSLWSAHGQVSFADDIGKRYASVSKDYNPIHISPLLARVFGFRQPLVHGMYSAALLLRSQPMSAPSKASFRFKRPIFMPSQAQIIEQGDRWALSLTHPRTGETKLSVEAEFEQ